MKIDRNKLKKSTTEVPADCRALIEKLKTATEGTLLEELRAVKAWSYGKCELYHWSDVLDKFDEVLEKACKKEGEKKWMLACDRTGEEQLKDLLLVILHFTSLLIEHSFSRHLYNSMEHLTCLLSSSDMTVVLAVLNLLYVFSKRSNHITRLSNDKKQGLIVRLTHLAESWGGKDNGFGLSECCSNDPISKFPTSATTLHFEFYVDNKEDKGRKGMANVISSIHMENLDKSLKLPSEIMEDILENFKVPEEKQMLLYTHIRLANLFSKYEARLQCVQARLQAMAILVYSNAIQDNMNALLYPGLIEELVDIIELKDDNLVEIKAASLRTLTSIIHLERNPKLNNIIDATGASSYHGFLPVLVRSCIQHMTDSQLKPFPQPYATALFSFLYHLASYENGVEALVSCGMMECLLKVISWYGNGQDHITQFVTRAVRVVDLITNLDMAAFQTQGGLSTFLNRLEHEVEICRKENPFQIRIKRDSMSESQDSPLAMEMDLHGEDAREGTIEEEASTSDASRVNEGASTSTGMAYTVSAPPNGVQCFPQRAALLKSMLNFLKKAIPDSSFSESIRHLMEGSLPKSLQHIISNAEYYGPSLFLLATDVVTVYVFQEPSLLSSLQDSGLTDVVLHALLIKDMPATREVLVSLPNVFSALCLNTRGLEAFVHCKPFDRLFKVLLSPNYLPAMRRRRSSDHFGDTASNLGSAMDELMRHQPSLRTDATKAIIKVLEEICAMGMDPKCVCQKSQPKTEPNIISIRSPQPPDNGSSDEEDEEEELANTQDSNSATNKPSTPPETPADTSQQLTPSSQEKQAVPLMDYVLTVMKFVEAILSHNSTDDHCREFVTQKGLQPLMSILGLPNLPIDFPASPACQAVSIVCKSILNLSREPQVLKQGLLKLDEVLQSLEALHQPLEAPGGSVLLHELANVAHIPDATQYPQNTPLLHALSSCHAYILMFVHVCRMGQTDIRTISVNHWGSDLGLKVLEGLSKLYTSLVWESTVLLALCNDDALPASCEFGKADMEKLLPKDFKPDKESKEESVSLTHSTGELGSNGVSAAMESLSTSESTETPMDVSDTQSQSTSSSDKDSKRPKISPALQAQVKQLKPLLSVSSRLCRALAELFGLLVKLCVGSPVRQRRSHQIPPAPTTPSVAAQSVARALTRLLTNGLQWTPPEYSPVPKLRLTFLVCSVGFTSPMLFDEKKQPYHLMLQKFVASGGQKALFDAFSWALSIDGKVQMSDGLEFPELPDGTGEFIDAWLMLVEKMVNPKTVLESTHTLPEKSTQAGFVPFSPVQYLISTQKAAFNAVMHLWNKKPLKIYGGRMSESILAILCHIIKGEGIIKEYLAKEKEETPGPSAGSSISILNPAAAAPAAAVQRPSIPEVNPSHLQQLMDMGFTREHASQALNHTTSMEQATEYILTHPLVPAPRNPTNPLGMVLEMSEEDQMMRAIAMSLGDNVLMSTDEGGPTCSSPKQEPPKPEEPEVDEKQEKEEPLDRTTIDQFTDTVMPGCLTLLDTLPETVYRVCDLLIVVTQRNGLEWQKRVLSSLVQEVQSLGHQLLTVGHVAPSTDESSPNNKKAFHPDSCKFATRLHLFSLLFEEARMPCAETVEKAYLTDLLVQVLSSGQEFLSANRDYVSPKWLAPLLLLLDLYEKVSVISRRKVDAEKLLAASHTWKWFDDSTGRWCKYSLGNNKTIDDAYQTGESSIRFQAGRRRYTVHFNTMMQVNEETGNRRPIMLTLPSAEEKQQAEQGDKKVSNKEGEAAQPSPVSESKMETEPVERKITRETKIVNGLNSDQVTSVIRSVVALLNIPVEAESLHAALRLILRLTREHKYAVLFAELGGPKVLLNLTQASAFQGFVSLATLIFRHILEEPASLKYCMEKAIKKATSGSGSSLSGVQQGSMGSKELHYVLRVLGPAACRNPGMFKEVARNTLRIALPRPSKRDEDENRLYGPNAPQILKSISTKQVISHSVESPIKEVLYDLLNCLIVKCNYKEPAPAAASVGMEVKAAQPLSEAIAEMSRELQERQANMVRQNSSAELQPEEESTSQTDLTGEQGGQTKDKDGKSTEDSRKQSLLMPKSLILRLLSEMVKSYGSCTQLITQHIYTGGQSELVPEECSVLAFVLDHLLPQCQTYGDRDCPALSRVFVASIASCNNRPDAQMALVAEIKNALQRSLCHPESSEKHVRIQSLTNLISIIIESCPSPGQMPNEVFKGQQTLMNNIVKSLLKKGVVSDLARIPHSLDLSSPYMANTINSALKPLETLSRSVNQPLQSFTAKTKGKLDLGESTSGQESTTENTTTAAEGAAVSQARDLTIEDITDQSEQHGDLEEAEPLEAEEPEHDLDNPDPGSQLQDVIDELLNRDSNLDTEREVLADIVMETEDISQASEHDDHGEDGDDELIDVEEMDHHDSHIVSQEISIEDEEGDDNTHVDVHDDDSAESATDGEEDDNDDGDNDDDQDDDDDDDEEDEEGSDMEAEDEDDYNDLEIDTPAGHQFHDENNVFNMDDMMFPLGNQHVIFNPLENNHPLHGYSGLQCPISIHDTDNGNELAVPTVVPPAPSNVMAAHPLLTRQPDSHGVVARIHRGGRQRGTCRYNPSTQTLHVNFPRPPNPPVILQRLLGPATAADVLQLTSTLTSVAGPTPTRVVLSNDDLRIMSRPDEDLFEELFQEPYPDSNAAGTGVLTYIPSTLTRWTEEAKVLDGDSINDCMTVLKPEIMEVLEQHRDEEVSERREKRKKAAEEEAAAKKEKEQGGKGSSDGWASPQKMEVSLDGVTPPSSSSSVSSTTTAPQTSAGLLSTALSDSNQDANGRQISASEAAAAAELIATEMAEGILSTATPSDSASRPADGLLSTATPSVMSTFLTPENPIPLTTPAAPIPRQRVTNDGRLNLASLLLSDQDPTPASQRTGVSSFGGLGEITAPLVGSQPVPVVPAAPTEGSITPEEVSGISSSGAVTVQSSASSEELAGSGPEILPTTSSPVINHPAAQTLDSGLRSFLMDGAPMSTGLDGAGGMADVSTSTSAQLGPNAPLLPSSILRSLDPGSIPLPPLATEGGGLTATDMMRGTLPSTWTMPTSTTNTAPTLGSAGSAEGPSSSSRSASDPSVPDGVDPSFLAALPDNIRQEVIAEQLRLQRIQQSAREQAQSAHSSGTMEVNAEFLAALPPNIQEEVLAQQRTEQARLQAQNAPAQPGTDTPVDPASFLATLPSSLRQQVLADMDDTMVAVLPPDLAAEAQSLRRELEDRHRRLMQDRLFAQAGAGSLSAILRHSGFAGRLGNRRYSLRAIPPIRPWGSNRMDNHSSSSGANAMKFRGRHLLDHEGITCLIVLLFVDEPKINTSRLHRVLRNLCYHSPTRIWVIRALLSILQKTGECVGEEGKTTAAGDKGKKKAGSSSSPDLSWKCDTKSQGSWLSISLEAALGCRANVFQIQKGGKKHVPGGSCTGTVTVHPQAAPVVCRHVLDTLIALAKVFPSQFLPMSKAKEVGKCEETEERQDSSETAQASPKQSTASGAESPKSETDFWDHLIKLDNVNMNRKGKGVQRTHNTSNTEGEANFYNFESSPLGQLMLMLSHPVVKRSQLLTDRLLRLLGLVSMSLPDMTRGNRATTQVPTSTRPSLSTAFSTALSTATSSMATPVVTEVVAPSSVPSTTPLEVKVLSKGEDTKKSEEEEKDEATVILEDQLKLAVRVLTSKSCSEEGLEDATNLLLRMSWANNATRNAVLRLLLEGAQELGLTVCSHIRSLLQELKKHSGKPKDDDEEMKEADNAAAPVGKGILPDRYSQGSSVVVAAPKKVKGGRELQLPSMTLLTNKTSSQQFLLRILKVIIQLRDAARTMVKRGRRQTTSRDLGNIAEAMAVLEAEAEAIIEMVGRRAQQNHQIRELQQQRSAPVAQAESSEATPTSTATGESGGATGTEGAAPGGSDQPTPTESARESGAETPMDVDQPGSSGEKKDKDEVAALPRLSEQVLLEDLWTVLGDCLSELAKTPDHHAVLILQPAVEAFFIVHAGEKDGKSTDQPSQKREDQLAHLNLDVAPASPASQADTPHLNRENSVASMSSISNLPPDTQKFLKFAETHRTVLNQILRQSTTPLVDGPFSVLVDHTRILDFDVKRRYFRQELERLDEGLRREDLAVHVRREHVFEDSFRELFRRTVDEWKHRFYIVFEGEEGQDAGGLLREWYIIIAREIFNPMYALFSTSPGDRVTYTINPSSHCNSNHLSYYKFVGRIIAKAIYDNKLLDCYFTRSFYKHIIGQAVKYTDMESEDYAFYQGLVFLLENDVKDLGYDLAFSTEIQEFGVTESRDLKADGNKLMVTEANKKEYVKLVCQMKMTGAIRKQLNAFMEGFYDIIPKRLISIFNEQELELLISGLPNIDIDDLKSNTEYHKYQSTSLQVQWFWRALRSFEQSDRAQFLQFVTGTSKVPLQGFAFLEGMNGFQKFQIHRDDRSTERLPVAHTCFNQLDLPAYETYDKLRRMLLLAINECSEGFGLA